MPTLPHSIGAIALRQAQRPREIAPTEAIAFGISEAIAIAKKRCRGEAFGQKTFIFTEILYPNASPNLTDNEASAFIEIKCFRK